MVAHSIQNDGRPNCISGCILLNESIDKMCMPIRRRKTSPAPFKAPLCHTLCMHCSVIKNNSKKQTNDLSNNFKYD